MACFFNTYTYPFKANTPPLLDESTFLHNFPLTVLLNTPVQKYKIKYLIGNDEMTRLQKKPADMTWVPRFEAGPSPAQVAQISVKLLLGANTISIATT